MVSKVLIGTLVHSYGPALSHGPWLQAPRFSGNETDGVTGVLHLPVIDGAIEHWRPQASGAPLGVNGE